MSIEGDVVWAGGKSWQRDEVVGRPNDKNWWYSPVDVDFDGSGVLLADLKRAGDFRWLVKNGQLEDGFDDGQLAMWDAHARMLGFDKNIHQSFRAALEDQRNQAALEERDAIVVWLHSDVDLKEQEARFIAGCIENGVHHGDTVTEKPQPEDGEKTSTELDDGGEQTGLPFQHFITPAGRVNGVGPWQATCSCGFVVHSPTEWNTHVQTSSSSISTSSPPTTPTSAGVPWSTLVEVGRREEREAIIAWLEDPRNSRYLAERIERGDHLRGDDE